MSSARRPRQGEALMRDLDGLPDAFGLIHGDLGYSNHLFHDGRAGAIDFEMCGFGYYLCDLAEVLWGVQHVRHFPQIRAALFEGYRRVRPFPRDLERRSGAAIGVAAVTTVGFLVQQRRDDLSTLADLPGGAPPQGYWLIGREVVFERHVVP